MLALLSSSVLGGAIPTLFIIVTLEFLSHPRSPRAVPSTRNNRCRPRSWRISQSAYGLDQPLWVQYARYLRVAPARRFRPLVQVQGLHGHRAHRPGIARDRGTRHRGVDSRAGARDSRSGRSRRCAETRPTDYAVDDACRRRHRGSVVRGAAAARLAVRHPRPLAAGCGMGAWLDPASCPAGRRADVAAACLRRATHARRASSRCCSSPFIRTAFAKGLPLAYRDPAPCAAPGADSRGGLSCARRCVDHDRLAGGGVDRGTSRASAAIWCRGRSTAITRWCSAW